jgi:enhancer of polycomb-like protein
MFNVGTSNLKQFWENFFILNSLLALSLEQDIPDYDMDSADETWFDSQTKSELTPFKFEQMMDRLEKITVCSLDDAKALVRRNEVNQDVFDYWVNKRLKTVRQTF